MKNLITLLLTLGTLLLITTLTILYSEGWRVGLAGNSENNSTTPVVIQTGMLAVRSVPEGAKVYLDDKLVTATDDTISSLTPGKHNLMVEKEGFESWRKNVIVYPELVTDITAVLVLQSPRLEPLTNVDVKAFNLSSNKNNIAFLTKNHKEPGVWILPLTGSPLNLFRNNTRLLIEDNTYGTPSMGENIWWSPDDKEILVQINETGYLLYNINNQNGTNLKPTPVTNVDAVFAKWKANWKTDFLDSRLQSVKSNQEIPEWIQSALKTMDTTWSPDDEKFFFTQPARDKTDGYELVVYNSEDPLPVGEERIYYPLKISNPDNIQIQWYSDSYHLILLESSPEIPNYYTVSLVRIDGTNLTPIYTGTLASNQAYPTPGGDKIIVQTSLKDAAQTNLYGIAIR